MTSTVLALVIAVVGEKGVYSNEPTSLAGRALGTAVAVGIVALPALLVWAAG